MAQSFSESNLPIIIVNTNGIQIVDEPKRDVTMSILDNPDGINRITDTAFVYEGRTGIELRGQSSQALFPKKSYGIEFRDDEGEDLDQEVLGMPEESDWVIYSPYSDKTLIRNVLTYHLAGQIMPYAPRVKLCELVIDDQYQDVVVWTEKIKRDKNRVDINKLKEDENEGDDLTGGYIVKFDKGANVEIGWSSDYKPIDGKSKKTNFLYHYPKYDDITSQQEAYIKAYISEFEDVLMTDGFSHPETGYRKYIDVSSFIQMIIINELTRNVDGYRLSTYMYKDKDSKEGKLTMGPVWDYNLAFGNADYCSGGSDNGWAYDFNNVCPNDNWVNHIWWSRLLESGPFVEELKNTWETLRQSTLSNGAILNSIDSLTLLLDQPKERNFQRWPVLGTYVWPNNFVGRTYADEINYLKGWITRRLGWLDENFGRLTTSTDDLAASVYSRVYPNPSDGMVNIDMSGYNQLPEYLELFDLTGQLIIKRNIRETIERINPSSLLSHEYVFYRLVSKGKIIESGPILMITDD